jgi:hypothetical protein
MNDHFGRLAPASRRDGVLDDMENNADRLELQKSTIGHDCSDTPDIDAGPASKRLHTWTRVHSHFALMGGFAFDTSKLNPNIFRGNRTRMTLGSSALQLLAANEPDLVPDISKDTVLDKSKANSFAKFLVCLQACWFVAQTTGRLATTSPISLLELNTLLHALCCLAIYVAWWHKPLNIDEPFLIDASGDRVRKICAWLAVYGERNNKYSWSSTETPDVEGLRLVYDQDIWSDNISIPKQRETRAMIKSAREYNSNRDWVELVDPDDSIQSETLWKMSPSKGEKILQLYPGQICLGFRVVLFTKKGATSRCLDAYRNLTKSEVECLRLAQSLRMEQADGGLWVGTSDGNERVLTIRASVTSTPSNDLDGWRGSNWLTRSSVMSTDIIFITGLLVAGSFYGGVHLLAWNSPFPTTTERRLWQISCLIITSPLAIFIAVVGLYYLSRFVKMLRFLECLMMMCRAVRLETPIQWFHAQLCKPIWRFLGPFFSSELFIGICVTPIILVYFAARVYLIVECFINIAHLPDAVFKEPAWSQYIPHFGSG